MKRLLSITPIVIMLAGCAGGVTGVGKSEFTCSGIPGSAYCMSTRDVYDVTNGADYMPDDVVPRTPSDDTPPVVLELPADAETLPANQPIAHSQTLSSIEYDKPIPVRTQAKIMRVYIAPWEDENSNLNMPGYVFTEVEGRMWNIGLPPTNRHVPTVPVIKTQSASAVINRAPVADAPLPPGQQ